MDSGMSVLMAPFLSPNSKNATVLLKHSVLFWLVPGLAGHRHFRKCHRIMIVRSSRANEAKRVTARYILK